MHSYNIDNFIGVFPKLYSDEYCDCIVNFSNSLMDKGLGYNRKQTQGASTEGHQIKDTAVFAHENKMIGGDIAEFSNVFWEQAYPLYAEKYSILKKADDHGIFFMKVQKTETGEGFHNWHFENSDRLNSVRLLTFTLYLNDVEEGGETEFLYYPMRVKPEKGTLLIFPAAFTHTHRGNQPLSGTKYIATGWLEY